MVWPGVSRTFKPHPWKLKRIAIVHGQEGVFRLGPRTKMDGRAALVAQLQMPGNKISMKMREKNVADVEAEFIGIGQVLLDVALRIDDDGGRTSLVSEQVRGVGQAAEIVLFQYHSLQCTPQQTKGNIGKPRTPESQRGPLPPF